MDLYLVFGEHSLFKSLWGECCIESGVGTEWIMKVSKGCMVNFGCFDADDQEQTDGDEHSDVLRKVELLAGWLTWKLSY